MKTIWAAELPEQEDSMSRRKSETTTKPAPVQEAPAEKGAASDVSNLDTYKEESVQVPSGAEVQLLEECRVAHKRLRLRKDPDRGAEVLKVLPIGTAVTVDLRTWRPDGVGVWMKAEADGLEGWVDTRYLARIEED